VAEWIKAHQHMLVRQLVEALNATLRGHYMDRQIRKPILILPSVHSTEEEEEEEVVG
jgi:hypothetical protein